ncbi:MAG: exosortase/archaeosortase family protein [Verrucomicrobia bacterium]|nr:exosortase/archaeosortase family protein [Verrucomicrobiota bacterium]
MAAVIGTNPDSVAPVKNRDRVTPALLTAILAYAWLFFFYQLSVFWGFEEDYRYGWAVPVLMAYLVYRRLKLLGPPQFKYSPLSLLVFFGGAVLLPLFRIVLDANLDWRLAVWLLAFATVGMTFSFAWMAGGKRWIKVLAFPILFSLTGVPWLGRIEIPVTNGLMNFGAWVATEVLNLLGVIAIQHGNVVETAGGMVGVDEACSGIKSLQTMVMIGLFFSDLTAWRGLKRFLVVIIGVLFATLANLIRIVILALVSNNGGEAGVAAWHDTTGTVAFAAACFALILVLRFLPPLESAMPSTGQPERSATHFSKAAGLLAVVGIFWLAVGELARAMWYEPSRSTGQRWNVTWPQNALTAKNLPIAGAVKDKLQCDVGSGYAWTTDPGTEWVGYFFQWNPGVQSFFARSQHSPEICLPATGRHLRADLGYFDVACGKITLRVRHQVFDDTNGTLNVFFIVDGSSVTNIEDQLDSASWRNRLRAVWERKKEADRRSLELIGLGYVSPESAQAQAEQWIKQLVQPLASA